MNYRLSLDDEDGGSRLVELYRETRRRAAEAVRQRMNRTPGVADTVLSRVPLDFEVMAYFADYPVNLYQLRQWLYPLERLNERHPVFILTRRPATFDILTRETSLPLVNARRIGMLDAIAQYSDIKLALYVNQTMHNLSALRYADMFHVYLSHGESEKAMYTATNQSKAYDYTFVAGDAAVERIKANLINFDWQNRLVRVGRPQLDVPVPPAVLDHAGKRRTVLYAPTWEGDRPSTSYGSVQSHGRAIVEAFTGSGRHRLIYRPHPRTGVTVPDAGTMDLELRELITRAAHADPSAGHRVDLSPQFGPQMYEADVMICDVSAVALDFLPLGKPLVVTVPTQSEATFDRSTFLRSVYELPVRDLAEVATLVDGWCDEDARADERSRWVAHYFGDVTPGASMQRFLDACDEAIAQRDKLIAEKRGHLARGGRA